ncbi:MAG: MerR family transcriptional regulator [Sphingobacteriales bacterium]|nr:MAG: MerR family transcriptional regulator [Sphingobacteriales bacterium]
MDSFTIKDLSNLSGIKAHTLRIWEQRYSFLKPSRSFTNIRYYSNEELKTILNIALLNKYGFKISHIDKMSAAEINDKILLLNQAEAREEKIINDLVNHMISMDMDAFAVEMDGYIKARGLEKMIMNVIFPFLEKIGILWMTNHINPAQEHLVSNMLRQKLIAGIDGCKPANTAAKKVILFLPEGEHHEMGLLFIHYLLKRKGVNVIYMGADLPLKDLAYVAQRKKPDYIYCHLTSLAPNFRFDRFLHDMQQQLKPIPLIISGKITHSYEKKIKPPVYFKRTLAESMIFVESL